jgi:O-acetyl-ADP-ribose deacetylase (regulator of RNase III)
MIRLGSGDLLSADVDALVNAVNIRGVMGAGIAAQFKLAFPDYFTAYRDACERGDLRMGRMWVYSPPTTEHARPRYLISFPTKDHWRDRSHLHDIETGIVDLRQQIISRQLASIALPALGCGRGGLRWPEVRPVIEAGLDGLDADVVVFPPMTTAPSSRRSRQPS